MGQQTCRALTILVVLCGLSFMSSAYADSTNDVQFPHRADYPQCAPITTERLVDIYDEAIVVDVRNQVEFDVIQVLGAKNLLAGKIKKTDLLNLRGLTDPTNNTNARKRRHR